LINVHSGLTAPSAGTVRYAGRSIHTLPAHRIARLGVARTFQNIRLFPAMTCLENVLAGQHLVAGRPLHTRLFWPEAARREEDGLRRDAREILTRVGLEGCAGVPASSLSYGERRRLEVARALASSPRLLLLDEPVAGMRGGETESVAALIRSLASERITVLLIEHNLDFVMGLCSRITVLNFGRTVATGTAEDISRNPQVIEAYLGAGDDDA
ncbi:MAG: ABC transporter ATP-binding protein, partial [Chloroflexota bacterium]|nr:ABC transporter ATP-binding protein [Chloroflexota bacterium]